MPHIELNSTSPGIVGLFEHRADTAGPLKALAETLLRGPSALSSAEREMIAAHVSLLNECTFCFKSHAAAAAAHLGLGAEFMEDLAAGLKHTPVSPRFRALLPIAARVREHGRAVSLEDVERARAAGATDAEIHDTILIAAAFCMYNRYVDGLGTWAPERNEDYLDMGKHLATQGYLAPPEAR